MASVTFSVFPAVDPAVPTGAVYSILLLLHVGCAVVGFGALSMTGIQARRARRGPAGARADGVRRYFRPGLNLVARALYGVPVFGFALISTSHGAFSAGDGFVLAGLGLWAAAALVAEFAVWPAERRIQEVVTARWTTGPEESGTGEWGPGESPDPPTTGDDPRFDLDCRRLVGAAALLAVVFLVAVVLMVAQP
jgi:hypothetical protein